MSPAAVLRARADWQRQIPSVLCLSADAWDALADLIEANPDNPATHTLVNELIVDGVMTA